MSGCSSSHEPTAKTVSGTFRRPAAASRSWRRAGSPDPWNVRATRPPVVGPWATKAAGPAGPLVADDGEAVPAGWSGAVAGGAARFAGEEQAPSTAAEAAPRKVRRLIATPHSGPGAQACTVTKLNTPGLAGFTVAWTQVAVKPGKVSSRVMVGASRQGWSSLWTWVSPWTSSTGRRKAAARRLSRAIRFAELPSVGSS